jgi:hypothetical protein
MALFKVNTGFRDGEVCGLRWEWEVAVTGSARSPFGTHHDTLLGGGVEQPARRGESRVRRQCPQNAHTRDSEKESARRSRGKRLICRSEFGAPGRI